VEPTVRWYFAGLSVDARGGRPLLLERHLERLWRGCERLSLVLDRALLHAELLAFCAGQADGVVKLIVTRGDGLRGYAVSPSPVRRILLSGAMPVYPSANAEQGVRLFPCVTRLAEQPQLAQIKHLNRLEQVLARAEWQDSSYAEGLMRDRSGRVIEAVFSNLLLCRDTVLVTADLSRCGVAGVMRAELLAQARSQGIACQVRDITFDEFLAADEVMLCNSVYGVWPVCAYEARCWPVGPLTRRLQSMAQRLLEG
jgi:4-amino-4-deoxychorismate lyase